MKTASVSRYAVIPMLRLTAPTWKLRAICGKAVAMMVPSRFSMKNAAGDERGDKERRTRMRHSSYFTKCSEGPPSPGVLWG